jgi:hypothetical protein
VKILKESLPRQSKTNQSYDQKSTQSERWKKVRLRFDQYFLHLRADEFSSGFRGTDGKQEDFPS